MISFSSFYDYCNRNQPNIIIYDDVNNNEITYPTRGYSQRGTMSNPLRLSLKFTSISVIFNPNHVILKGDNGTMRFDYVKGVRIKPADTVLGDTITLYCSNDENKTSYTLIMRQEQ